MTNRRQLWSTYAICALCSLLCSRSRVQAEIVLGEETDEFDFDGLPGAQHQFSVEVGPGRADCYYQRVAEGGSLYLSYEVLRGGDVDLILFLFDPETNTVIQKTEQGQRGGFNYESAVTKTYAICLENTFSRVKKLVFVYIVSYLEEEWTRYRQEIEDVELTVGNFSTSVNKVRESIQAAYMHQAGSRMHVIRDWYLITGNNTYIQRWSILQCIIIVGSTFFQVYYLRRLFRNVNVPTKRPRA